MLIMVDAWYKNWRCRRAVFGTCYVNIKLFFFLKKKTTTGSSSMRIRKKRGIRHICYLCKSLYWFQSRTFEQDVRMVVNEGKRNRIDYWLLRNGVVAMHSLLARTWLTWKLFQKEILMLNSWNNYCGKFLGPNWG